MTAVTKRARFLLAVLIVMTGVGCDQATKQIAAQQLRGTPPISFMHDLVRLQYAENQGAFLGLGNSLSPELRFWLLTVIDFLNLGLGSLRTGIFNIADVAITGGVVLLWTASFRKAPQSNEPTES